MGEQSGVVGKRDWAKYSKGTAMQCLKGFRCLRLFLILILLSTAVFECIISFSWYSDRIVLADIEWQEWVVDASGPFSEVSMAIDQSDRFHMAYCGEGQDLFYATGIGDLWKTELVATGTVSDPSIAIDRSGNPAISFHEERGVLSQSIRLARYDGTAWNIQTVDSSGWVGTHNSLAFSGGNTPTMSYYEYFPSTYDLKFAFWNGSNWSVDTIDEKGKVGRFTSLVYDSSGTPGISYFDETNGDLRYAYWEEPSWVTGIVDDTGSVGKYSSLAFTRNDVPCISYYDETNGDLKYAQWNGMSWRVSTVDSGEKVGQYTSLAFDNQGQPCISYYDAGNNDLKYAQLDGNRWIISTVVSEGTVGKHSSIVFDSRDRPAISYIDDSKNSIKLAISTINHPPSAPTNVSPEHGARDVGLVPILVSSGFSDPDDDDTHRASQWQVGEGLDGFDDPVYDSGTDTVHLEEITLPEETLIHSSAFYWRVRHQDDGKEWSDYSPATSFSTISTKTPDRPKNILPEDGAEDISLMPVLRSSQFSDPESGDTHRSSQWLIATSSQGFDAPVFDSEADTSNLTEITIPAETLNQNSIYYWRVRHQDDKFVWSQYSKVTSFTTRFNNIPNQPYNVAPPNDDIDVKIPVTLISSDFSDDDEGDSHSGSQWQITDTPGDYDDPIMDTGTDYAHILRITLSQGVLESETVYYWRVRHRDSGGMWSPYSMETTFKTRSNSPPYRPSNISPFDGATNIELEPTLACSVFSDPDSDDVHLSAQWQITETKGRYGAPVFQSYRDTPSLTEVLLPSGILEPNTTYYWRVRYQDYSGVWSEYSHETSFLTVSEQIGSGDSLGASYRGIKAFSNGGDTGTVKGAYQSTEYVKRFYRDAMQMDTDEWPDIAGDYYDSSIDLGLLPCPNSCSIAPLPDDIICIQGPDYSHVAIVVEVGRTYVNIIDQNRDRNSNYLTLPREANIISIPSNSKMPMGSMVKGWLRMSRDGGVVTTLQGSGELRIYDSSERLTGSVGGKAIVEIPYSTTDDSTIVVLPLSNSYRYDIVGIEEGAYDFMISAVRNQQEIGFTAVDIPISENGLHRYSIDWDTVARGDRGISISIDSEDDGVFEVDFTSDYQFTRDQFQSAMSQDDVAGIPLWMWIGGAGVILLLVCILPWRRVLRR
ncbi:MAG: CHAP domain-containing protein [Chloroflexota bacterium]|nr:CHAP domain-containing protein [Chloroflexota bacterium]